jgi:hypothetical protein
MLYKPEINEIRSRNSSKLTDYCGADCMLSNNVFIFSLLKKREHVEHKHTPIYIYIYIYILNTMQL